MRQVQGLEMYFKKISPKVMFLCLPIFFRTTTKNSRPEVFCKKGVLGNFAKFTGKHVCQALLFNILAGLDLYRYFPVNFLCIFLRIFSGGCLPKHVVLKTPQILQENSWNYFLVIVKLHPYSLHHSCFF